MLGPPIRERAYSHWAACGAGCCPRDQTLGLHGTSVSPAVGRMAGVVGAMVSFQEGSELLRELAGVEVTPKHVERAAEALGREIVEEERRVVEPLPPAAVAPTLSPGMDGTGIPMRAAELDGRVGEPPDGSAKTREVKLCTVCGAEARDEEGARVRDLGSVTSSAALESAASRDTDDRPSDFAARVPGRRRAGALPWPRAAWSWAMGPCGSGTSPMSTSPAPSRAWTASMPESICAPWPRPSMA